MFRAIKEIATVKSATVFREAPKLSDKGNVYGLTIKDLVGTWPNKIDQLFKIEVPDQVLNHTLQGGEILIPARGDYYPARYFQEIGRPIIPYGQINIIFPRAGISGRYLAWCLNQPDIQKKIENLRTGTNILSLTRPNLLNIEVLVPSFEVQDAISQLQTTWEYGRSLYSQLMEIRQKEVDTICRCLVRKESES